MHISSETSLACFTWSLDSNFTADFFCWSFPLLIFFSFFCYRRRASRLAVRTFDAPISSPETSLKWDFYHLSSCNFFVTCVTLVLQVLATQACGIKLAFSTCLLQCLHCTDEAHIGRNRGSPVYSLCFGHLWREVPRWVFSDRLTKGSFLFLQENLSVVVDQGLFSYTELDALGVQNGPTRSREVNQLIERIVLQKKKFSGTFGQGHPNRCQLFFIYYMALQCYCSHAMCTGVCMRARVRGRIHTRVLFLSFGQALVKRLVKKNRVTDSNVSHHMLYISAEVELLMANGTCAHTS